MISRMLRQMLKNQRGFTLIEVLVAVAIGGAIAGAGSMATRQVMTETVRNNNHEIAVRQTQQAGHWVTRDTQKAQTVDDTRVNNPDGSTTILTLTWEDLDGTTEEEVVYSLVEVNDVLNLKREHYTNANLDTTNFTARYIDSDPAKTNCDFENPPMLTFTVTATVGGGSLQEGSETRIYEIVHRAVADSS